MILLKFESDIKLTANFAQGYCFNTLDYKQLVD